MILRNLSVGRLDMENDGDNESDKMVEPKFESELD